jgi:hypothetical protein
VTSAVLLECGRNVGIAVYIPEQTILKEKTKVKPAFLF